MKSNKLSGMKLFFPLVIDVDLGDINMDELM